MSDIAIKAENVSKVYQIGANSSVKLQDTISNLFKKSAGGTTDFWALNDVSFEIKKGDAVGFIGKNGAGKSTLLKILSKITEPTEGRITMEGRVSSLLEVGTGFHPELSGRENVFLNGTILGMRRSEIKAKFDEIVAFSGIEKFIDTPVKRYSSGMYVRLAFAVAAHLEPEILIIDEVLAVGDAEFQRKCLGKMKQVAQNGRTVLFVSHNMQAISTLTNQCVFMAGGKNRFAGPTDQAIAAYLSYGAVETLDYQSPSIKDTPYIDSVNIVTSAPGNVQYNKHPMTIRFRVKNCHLMKRPGIAFTVNDSSDVPIAHFWVFNNELDFNSIDNQLYLECSIPNFRIYQGKYSITCYLANNDGTEVVEVVENVCPFEVVMYGQTRDVEWKQGVCTYIEDFTWQKLS